MTWIEKLILIYNADSTSMSFQTIFNTNQRSLSISRKEYQANVRIWENIHEPYFFSGGPRNDLIIYNGKYLFSFFPVFKYFVILV